MKTTPCGGARPVEELYTEDGVFYDPKGAYAGADFIIARDGRIAALYLFFDKLT